MFWRKKQAQPPAVACFGKLPATGDFIRLNASTDEFTAFDEWVASSVALARESLAAGWEAAYRPAAGLFIYRGPEAKGDEPDRGLIGAWVASRDSAGRNYPMAVCGSYDFEQMLATGAALPIALWPFLKSAYELAIAGATLGVDDFLGRVAQIQPPSLDNPDGCRAAYAQWLQHQQMGALWETCFGGTASRFGVIHDLQASVEIFRGQERPETHLAIRFPLGAGDAYAAAVWMDMTVRLAGWERTLLNAFWTPQRHMLVHMGPPHAATFRELIAPSAEADHVTDLSRQRTEDDATLRERLGPKLAELTDKLDTRIDRFLQSLAG
ncbi:MAG: type VI secretion system-associated protein TagF [Deltaproteobacteria bacterium]|jgi:type VI secretion system protein ImpM|nr:type VI secretion system-associated protein TagF [Deltaproteobacteria bacterium]MBW2537808.1 type VI secretion system-associated protein TagF [Deltaproteobacteria bacterium]